MKLFFLFFVSLLFFSSCGTNNGITFDPDFFVGDYQRMGIVNRDNFFVPAFDPTFNNYACMSEEKVKELSVILHKAKMPKVQKSILEKQLAKTIWWRKIL